MKKSINPFGIVVVLAMCIFLIVFLNLDTPNSENINLGVWVCNTSEWNPYVESLKKLPNEEILSRLKESCESATGTPNPNFWVQIAEPIETTFVTNIARSVCSIKTASGGSFGLWGISPIDENGNFNPDSNQEEFTLPDVGICFKRV